MTLREALFDIVGLGEDEEARKGLYLKILRLHGFHGDVITRIVGECWMAAVKTASKYPPGHYFCRAVKRRLIKAQLWHEKSPLDGLGEQDMLKTAFPDDRPLPLFEREKGPGIKEQFAAAFDRMTKREKELYIEMPEEKRREWIEQRGRKEAL